MTERVGTLLMMFAVFALFIHCTLFDVFSSHDLQSASKEVSVDEIVVKIR